MAAQTTPDLSEFHALSRPKKAPCQVGCASEHLTEGEQTALAAACATDRGIITAGAIGKWLEARGHKVNSSAITHHRNGACTCV